MPETANAYVSLDNDATVVRASLAPSFKIPACFI